MTEKRLSTDAVAWAYSEFIKDDPERAARFELLRAQSALAQTIYDIRNKLKMTREDLAKHSGLTPETIEDIEESDYDGDWIEATQNIKMAFTTWVTKVIVPTYKTSKPEQPWDYNKEELIALLETLRQKGIKVKSSVRVA
ncbi:MAG: helix-turn-helix domain-containing protein [Pseudomonadota bacterium]